MATWSELIDSASIVADDNSERFLEQSYDEELVLVLAWGRSEGQ